MVKVGSKVYAKMIRKGRLWRECNECGKKFEPASRQSWHCRKCLRKKLINRKVQKYKYGISHPDFLSKAKNLGVTP